MIINLNKNLTQNNRNQQSLDEIYGSFVPYQDVQFIVEKFKGKCFSVFKDVNILALSKALCQEEILNRVKSVEGMRVAINSLKVICSLTDSERRVLNTLIRAENHFNENYLSQESIARLSGTVRETANRAIAKLAKANLIVKFNRGFGKTRLYAFNTIFNRQDVRSLFVHLLPALKSLPINIVTQTYKYKLSQLKHFAKTGIVVGVLGATLSLLQSFKREENSYFAKKEVMEADKTRRNPDFVGLRPEKGTTSHPDQQLMDSITQDPGFIAFEKELEGAETVDVKLSPVIEAITPAQIPGLTLAGRVFLSQYPDAALEHGLSLLSGKQEEPFTVVKEAAWNYLRQNSLKRLMGKFEALRAQHKITGKEPFVEKPKKKPFEIERQSIPPVLKPTGQPGVYITKEGYKIRLKSEANRVA